MDREKESCSGGLHPFEQSAEVQLIKITAYIGVRQQGEEGVGVQTSIATSEDCSLKSLVWAASDSCTLWLEISVAAASNLLEEKVH